MTTSPPFGWENALVRCFRCRYFSTLIARSKAIFLDVAIKLAGLLGEFALLGFENIFSVVAIVGAPSSYVLVRYWCLLSLAENSDKVGSWNSNEISLICIMRQSFQPSPTLKTMLFFSMNFVSRTKYCLCSARSSYPMILPTWARINAKWASRLEFPAIMSNYR